MTSRPPNQNQNPQPSSPPTPSSSPTKSRFRRLYDKLRNSLRKPRKFLSLLYPFIHLSLSKTLGYLSTDMFSPQDDDDVFIHGPAFRPSWYSPEPDVEEGKLFFVPYRWWVEAANSLGESIEVNGVLYSAESSLERAGLYDEIVLNLRTVDVSNEEKSGYSEGEAYTLVAEDKSGYALVAEEGGAYALVAGGASPLVAEDNRVYPLVAEDKSVSSEGGTYALAAEDKSVSAEGGASPLAAADKSVSSEGGAYALVAEWMFLRALKWHNDMKGLEGLLAAENSMEDLFALEIRLFFYSETNSLLAKVFEKENKFEAFWRARDIFCTDSGLLSIWDFSGQTTEFLRRDRPEPSFDSGQQVKEIHLELLVYGYSNFMKMQPAADQSTIKSIFDRDSVERIGPSDTQLHTRVIYNSRMGLTGIYNLGNTCFMNSAIQCLVHTPRLVDYFLGDYRRDLNAENPLGMKGELALAFGELLRKLWSPAATPVTPRAFKSKLAAFAPQFSGYNQHDSQELLAFLLDGLHEDLNRVKCKPYIEAKDAEARPDDEVADEHWRNHLARNNSIIVDVCQGQYRSTLVCPVCEKSSVTFDPFMYLSLPLPSTTKRSMTLTVLRGDGTALPSEVTVTVPEHGTCDDLLQALSTACSLGDNETLLVAEIYNDRIHQFLDNSLDKIDLLRDCDKLVAYVLPKDMEESPLIVFIHDQGSRLLRFNLDLFGIPLVSRASNLSRGSDIRDLFLKLLNPFNMLVEEDLNGDVQNNPNEDFEMEERSSDQNALSDGESDDDSDSDFQFYLQEGMFPSKGPQQLLQMDEPVSVPPSRRVIRVLVSWPKEKIASYDTCLLSYLPQIRKTSFFARQPRESVSLYKCLEAFLKEEPLGPEDMWYCPNCKEHQQACKKLDLWRLPEILIIHLKRFSYSRFLKNKLETLVDFPVDDLNLQDYVACKSTQQSCRYKLYAISNHIGGMGGGHYTAFAQHGDERWYEFDDSRVSLASEDDIKTSAAYVLFYKRVVVVTDEEADDDMHSENIGGGESQ